jgi:hypothetical protein
MPACLRLPLAKFVAGLCEAGRGVHATREPVCPFALAKGDPGGTGDRTGITNDPGLIE